MLVQGTNEAIGQARVKAARHRNGGKICCPTTKGEVLAIRRGYGANAFSIRRCLVPAWRRNVGKPLPHRGYTEDLIAIATSLLRGRPKEQFR